MCQNNGNTNGTINIGNTGKTTNSGSANVITNSGSANATTNSGSASATTNSGSANATTNSGSANATTNSGSANATTNSGSANATTNSGSANTTTNAGNFVGAANNGIAPTNPQPISTESSKLSPMQEEILDYEKYRRNLFEIAVTIALFIIILSYIGLGLWIRSQSNGYHIHDNMWHIALILTIPPTTLFFLILKILARQQPTESSSHSPLMEFGNQLLGILREFLTKK